MSTDQLERAARDWFLLSMDTSMPPAEDTNGKKVALTASDRLVQVTRNSRVKVSSDNLTTAVVRLLQQQGIAAEQQPLITDPASGDKQTEVLGLRIAFGDRQLVAPIVPGAEAVRLYATTADGDVVPDDVVMTLNPALVQVTNTKTPKSYPWASARAIAEAIKLAVAQM